MKQKLLIISCFLLTQAVYSQDCTRDSLRREQVNTSNAPNAFTCYMVMKRGRSERYGTGFLIHPRILITAGHNIAWYPTGAVKSVDLYFGSVDSEEFLLNVEIPLKKNVSKFFKRSYWLRDNIVRDYAIVVLPDSSVYNELKAHYSCEPIDSAAVYTHPIHITGSPGDKDFHTMWTEETDQVELNEGYIRYNLYTVVRNSGSPIWQKVDDGYRAIGVHSRSFGTCGAATLINQDVYSQIQSWSKSVGIDF